MVQSQDTKRLLEAMLHDDADANTHSTEQSRQSSSQYNPLLQSLRYANACCSAVAAPTSLAKLAGGVDQGGSHSQEYSHKAGPAEK